MNTAYLSPPLAEGILCHSGFLPQARGSEVLILEWRIRFGTHPPGAPEKPAVFLTCRFRSRRRPGRSGGSLRKPRRARVVWVTVEVIPLHRTPSRSHPQNRLARPGCPPHSGARHRWPYQISLQDPFGCRFRASRRSLFAGVIQTVVADMLTAIGSKYAARQPPRRPTGLLRRAVGPLRGPGLHFRAPLP